MGILSVIASLLGGSGKADKKNTATDGQQAMPEPRRVSDEVLKVLETALEDRDSDVRVSGAWALGRCGDGRAVEALQKHLADADKTARCTIAWALVKLGAQSGFAALRQLTADTDDYTRCQAVSMARQTGDSRFIETMISALKDSYEGVSNEAICGLADFGGPEAENAFLAALADPGSSSSKRAQIAGSLADLACERAIPFLKKAFDNGSAGIWERNRLAEALARLGRKDSLIGLLADPQGWISCQAAGLLAELGDNRGLPIILSHAGGDDSDAREAAAGALRHFKEKDALDCLLVLLKDSDQSVRNHAAESLGVMGDERAVAPLIQALGDRSEWVASNAARALGQIGGKGVYEALEKAQDTGPQSWLSCGKADAMVSLNDPRAITLLEKILNHRVPYVRKFAADAMAKLKDPRAIPLLRARLNDPDGQTRCAIAEALAALDNAP